MKLLLYLVLPILMITNFHCYSQTEEVNFVPYKIDNKVSLIDKEGKEKEIKDSIRRFYVIDDFKAYILYDQKNNMSVLNPKSGNVADYGEIQNSSPSFNVSGNYYHFHENGVSKLINFTRGDTIQLQDKYANIELIYLRDSLKNIDNFLLLGKSDDRTLHILNYKKNYKKRLTIKNFHDYQIVHDKVDNAVAIGFSQKENPYPNFQHTPYQVYDSNLKFIGKAEDDCSTKNRRK